MQLSRLCKFVVCFFLLPVFTSDLSDDDLVVTPLFMDALKPSVVRDLINGSDQITYLAFPAFSFDDDDDDELDEEEHRRFLWAAGRQRDHEVVIRLLQKNGGEDLLAEILEAFYQNGRPESQVDVVFFLDHCNSCREKSVANLLETMEKISNEAIVTEAVRLFELGGSHEINDMFLFMTEPLPVPRLVRRLNDDAASFAKLLLMAAGNRLRLGVRRLLQIPGAPQAIEWLTLYNQAHENEIEAELHYIATIAHEELSFYDTMLLRLCAIHDQVI